MGVDPEGAPFQLLPFSLEAGSQVRDWEAHQGRLGLRTQQEEGHHRRRESVARVEARVEDGKRPGTSAGLLQPR